MTREELIKLVIQIKSIENKTEREINTLLGIFEKNVPHPAVSDLIYWDELTPEQIVDKAMQYKPIQL